MKGAVLVLVLLQAVAIIYGCCRHDEDGDEQPALPIPDWENRPQPPKDFSYSVQEARLVGGTSSGRLEVKINDQWSTACSHGFTWEAADLFCRVIGFRTARQVLPDGTFPSGSGTILLDNVRCPLYAPSFEYCCSNQLGVVSDCQHSDDVAIECTDDEFMPSCCMEDGVNSRDARRTCVPCRVRNEPNSTDGDSTDGGAEPDKREKPTREDRMNCAWKDCRDCYEEFKAPSCHVGPDYGEKPVENMRLVGGDGPHKGILEVEINGEWGTVCDDTVTWEVAKIACQHLGFREAVGIVDNTYGSGSGRVLLGGVRCGPRTYELRDCCQNEVATVHSSCMNHNRDVAIECTNATYFRAPCCDENFTDRRWCRAGCNLPEYTCPSDDEKPYPRMPCNYPDGFPMWPSFPNKDGGNFVFNVQQNFFGSVNLGRPDAGCGGGRGEEGGGGCQWSEKKPCCCTKPVIDDDDTNPPPRTTMPTQRPTQTQASATQRPTTTTTTTPPPNPEPIVVLSCTFEAGDECGSDNDRGQQKWELKRGATGSSNTGPSVDHTTGSGDGTYFYLEVSNIPRNNRAVMRSPPVRISNNEGCLKFWYHMYGIEIYRLEVTVANSNSVLFQKEGDQGDVWIAAVAPLPRGDNIQLDFTAYSGGAYRGDIAIDDISITNAPCPNIVP